MSAELILNLINEVLNNPKMELITEQDEDGKTVIKFPKFKINEKNWGKDLETEDRAVIERIGSQLKGGTPLDRVAYLQQFLTETEQVKEDITVGEIMGALMFLDIFASIVFEFNASVAGFLFEALFAGIFEGFQIEAKEGGGEAGTTDVVLNVKPKGKGSKSGVEYSFKLLSDANAVIKGSFKDLIDGISKSKGASETYLVVLKSGTEDVMNLDFYEYDINQDNWFEWVGAPVAKEVTAYEEKEFEFDSPDTPEEVMSGLTGGSITIKIKEDGSFMPKKPSGYSKLKADERRAYNKSYEETPGEEVEVRTPKAGLKRQGLKREDGEIPNYLIPGKKYKIQIPSGTKRVVDYEASANFKELYKDFLKPDGFEGPSGEDFVTYVGEGTYKKDSEFFDKLKTLGTYTGKGGAGQFITRGSYMKRHPNVRGPERLTLDREKFQAAANAYTDLVGKQIFDIFTNLGNLIDDVSGYFLGVSANERNKFAAAAKDRSKQLAESAEENLVEITEDDTEQALQRQKYRRQARAGQRQIGTMSDVRESKEFDDQLQLLMKEVFGR
jgi:hypothetical protein